MGIVRYELKPGVKLSEEQVRRIREAAKRPIVFDEDSPEMTDEELSRFRPVREKKRIIG